MYEVIRADGRLTVQRLPAPPSEGGEESGAPAAPATPGASEGAAVAAAAAKPPLPPTESFLKLQDRSGWIVMEARSHTRRRGCRDTTRVVVRLP